MKLLDNSNISFLASQEPGLLDLKNNLILGYNTRPNKLKSFLRASVRRLNLGFNSTIVI
jgi:hypothetical protein